MSCYWTNLKIKLANSIQIINVQYILSKIFVLFLLWHICMLKRGIRLFISNSNILHISSIALSKIRGSRENQNELKNLHRIKRFFQGVKRPPVTHPLASAWKLVFLSNTEAALRLLTLITSLWANESLFSYAKHIAIWQICKKDA